MRDGDSVSGERLDVAIVGLGPIGASEALYLSAAGHRCVGIEISEAAILFAKDPDFLRQRTDLSAAEINIFAREFRVIGALSDLPQQADTYVLCVPTEYDGRPNLGTLNQVIQEIVASYSGSERTPHLLVESTVIPGYYDSFVAPLIDRELGAAALHKFRYGYSPRRDWFLSSERANRGVYRILSANTDDALNFFESMLRPAWHQLVVTRDIVATEVAKLFENAVRYIAISYAQEVARAFPTVNIDHVFELAGSKWNVERYYSSLGVGGYCTPTSTRYLVASPLCQGDMRFAKLADDIAKVQVADCVAFLRAKQAKAVGIIGLRYRPPFRSAVESAAMRLASALHNNDITVFAFDSMLFDEDKRHEHIKNLRLDHAHLDALVLHVVATEKERKLARTLVANPNTIIIDNREDQSDLFSTKGAYYSTRHQIIAPRT